MFVEVTKNIVIHSTIQQNPQLNCSKWKKIIHEISDQIFCSGYSLDCFVVQLWERSNKSTIKLCFFSVDLNIQIAEMEISSS